MKIFRHESIRIIIETWFPLIFFFQFLIWFFCSYNENPINYCSGTSYLTFPAIILLCLGGVPIRIANMQFANLFPKNRSAVITFYSGAFSASAVIFVLLKYVYDEGVPFQWVCSSLVVFSLMMVPFTLFILPEDQVRDESVPDSLERMILNKKYHAKNNLAMIGSTITLEKYKVIASPILERRSKNGAFCYENPVTVLNVDSLSHLHDPTTKTIVTSCQSRLQSPVGELQSKSKVFKSNPVTSINGQPCTPSLSSSESCVTERSPSVSSASTSEAVSDDEVPLRQSLLSLPFSLHQWWYSWLITYMIMYVGSMNLWLGRVTNDL